VEDPPMYQNCGIVRSIWQIIAMDVVIEVIAILIHRHPHNTSWNTNSQSFPCGSEPFQNPYPIAIIAIGHPTIGPWHNMPIRPFYICWILYKTIVTMIIDLLLQHESIQFVINNTCQDPPALEL
jgi:hypothetical protein